MAGPLIKIIDSKKSMFDYVPGCGAGIQKNEMNLNAKGGTELMQQRMWDNLVEAGHEELLDKFQVIPSRVRELDPDRIRLLWCHDLAEDGEVQFLKDEGYQHFDKLVFVSHWQQQMYQTMLGVPYSMGYVLQNAMHPSPDHVKPDPKDEINLIYHTTPHRGLDILLPVFQSLYDDHWKGKVPVKLHVYSSFEIYGWKENDAPFKELFDQCIEHEAIEYHGVVDNEVMTQEVLPKMHIFAYPSTWPETSCISLMEAMSAGLCCVHSSFAALPETSANWTMMYPYHEDKQKHAETFAQNLFNSVRMIQDRSLDARLGMQSVYANSFYSWDVRTMQWSMFLQGLEGERGDAD